MNMVDTRNLASSEVMKIKAYRLIFLAMALIAASITTKARAESTSSREYQIKAAFLYNFIKFVDWPEEKTAGSDNTINIGIIGEDPFEDAFEPIKDKRIKGRNVVIKRFKSIKELKKNGGKGKPELHPEIDAIKKCHLLFICSSEKKNSGEIIKALNDSSVLTVGETAGFLEDGGIIKFIMEEQKIRFEINATTAEETKLKIRSKLLRLARKVAWRDRQEKQEGNYV
jgi:hypothetical protein